MKPVMDFFVVTDGNRLGPDLVMSIARCYMDVFNRSWQEDWTIEKAFAEVSQALLPQPGRFALLSLLRRDDTVLGFAWGVVSELNAVYAGDMPFILPDDKKADALKTVRHWFGLAGHDRLLVYRELGILPEYRNYGRYGAAALSLPIMEKAVSLGLKALLYWTNTGNPSFKQGIGFGWHPIAFYPAEDRVIMTGAIAPLIECLKGVVAKDRSVMRLMRSNRSLYWCE